MSTHEKRATELVEQALADPFDDSRRELLAAANVYATLELAKQQAAGARAVRQNAATVERLMTPAEPPPELMPEPTRKPLA